MIHRRILDHLKRQDWTAVAVEFVLVVLGVFLGFQLTEWNAQRIERGREESYLVGVAGDLRGDIAEMEENTRTAESRMAALGLLLEKAGRWVPPSGYPSSRYFIDVEKIPPLDPTRGYTIGIETFILSTLDGNRFAYNTLIAADGIGVIRDRPLVRDIQGYYAKVDEVIDFERSLAENRLRYLDAMQVAGISAVDGSDFDTVAAVVRRNPPLAAATRNYWLYANRHVRLTRELTKAADRLAARIEREYGNQPAKDRT